MTELAAIFGSSLVIAYSGALMPGPMLTVVVAETPRQGAKAGPLVVLGHAALELALLVMLVLGFGAILERPVVQGTLGVIGGVVLFVMAALMLMAVLRHRVALQITPGGESSRHARTVLAGVTASVSNPYWITWWATIGLGLLTKAYALGVAGVVAFYLGHILGDLTWFTAVSGLLSAGRRWITLRRYRGMIVVAACVLMLLSVWFLAAGVRVLMGRFPLL